MFDSPLSDSAYQVLGVDPAAEHELLRKAYRVRLRETHPDTGGDATVFIQVQRAWELVGTPDARAAYDRGHGFVDPTSAGDFVRAPAGWRGATAPAADTSRSADTRPKARIHGHPGGWRRERYLSLMREWAGRGVTLDDPYDPALVRRAPQDLRRILADALAEEETARVVADLGMGFTVWHDVVAGGGPEDKLDHIVLGPSGLYGVLSEDFGAPVGFRRGEIVGAHVPGAPVNELVSRVRVITRDARVKFSGAIVVLPDEDVAQQITELGKVRGIPVVVVGRSALATILRRGVSGGREVGGNELFDLRTRLDHKVRFV